MHALGYVHDVSVPDVIDRADGAELLAREAVEWILGGAGADWSEPSLYHGRAGMLLALHEAAVHFDGQDYDEVVDRGAELLSARLDDVADSSLYFGLTGVAFALGAVGFAAEARRAMAIVRGRVTAGRWSDMFELLSGNAGIGLGALAVGDLDLAVDAVTPYVQAATRTAGGVNWQVRPTSARSHHVAHGTLGIVHALAAIGSATGRPDLVELALEGAADVVARNEAEPDGFLVPHSDPPHRPDVIERYSLGWCNGPAGDAQVFRLLARTTQDQQWAARADQCWRTITESGLPRRLRPGFWDNSGRCCGTAGVLALALDRIVEDDDGHDFAHVLVADLHERVTVDHAGARWSNHEHRVRPPGLEPRPGWAMGNAGIVPELLRYARIFSGGRSTYAVLRPDHPPTT